MQRQYPKQTKVNLNTTQVNKEWCGKLLILQSLFWSQYGLQRDFLHKPNFLNFCFLIKMWQKAFGFQHEKTKPLKLKTSKHSCHCLICIFQPFTFWSFLPKILKIDCNLFTLWIQQKWSKTANRTLISSHYSGDHKRTPIIVCALHKKTPRVLRLETYSWILRNRTASGKDLRFSL